MNTLVKNIIPSVLSDDFSTGQWKNRRLVIFCALLVCAFCVVGVTIVVIGAIGLSAWKGSSPAYDTNLLRLAETIVWATITLATGVIGSYVFAANFDTKDYRKNVVEMQSRGISTTVESKVTTTGVAPVVPVVPDMGNQPDEVTTTTDATTISVDPGTTTTIQTDTTKAPVG